MTIPAVGVHGNCRMAFIAEFVLVLMTLDAGLGQTLLKDLVAGRGHDLLVPVS